MAVLPRPLAAWAAADRGGPRPPPAARAPPRRAPPDAQAAGLTLTVTACGAAAARVRRLKPHVPSRVESGTVCLSVRHMLTGRRRGRSGRLGRLSR